MQLINNQIVMNISTNTRDVSTNRHIVSANGLSHVLVIIIIIAFTCNQANAQSMYVCQSTGYMTVPAANAGNMLYSNNGQTLTINNTSYPVTDIDSIVFTKPSMKVWITYNGTSATIVDATGGQVSVLRNKSGHVALSSAASETGNADEIEYIVSGASTNGSLYISGDYKLKLTLNGISLVNPDSAAIRVKCGKTISVNIADGTTNSLTDGKSNDNNDACFWIKGHAEISGGGTLNLTGKNKHAFKSGEYCQLKKSCGTINILSAPGDGMHCSEYFKMNGGTVTINNTYGDGIDADSLGNVLVNGGNLTITIDTITGKGIKCDSTYTQTDGNITLTIPSTMLSAKGIDIGKNGFLSGGSITATVSANGSKGIKGDGNFTMSGGTMTMTCSGGKDKITDPTDPSKCYGVKLDGTWSKTGGTCAISTTSSVAAAIKDATKTYGADGTAE